MNEAIAQDTITPGGTAPRWSALRSRGRRVVAFLLSSIFGLVVGGVIMAVTGHSPIDAYRAMWDGAVGGPNYANLDATINRAIPIVGMGLATAIAFRAGFFNLGGEGQLVIGGFVGSLVALYAPIPWPLLMPCAVVAGALAAGSWAALAAFLQFRFAIPLLISTLILNYPADYVTAYFVSHHFRDVTTGMDETAQLPASVGIPALPGRPDLHFDLVVVVALVVIVAFVMRRTTLGYELNMAGLNARFARYGGVSIERLGYTAMFASGAVAGIVGSITVFAQFGRYINGALIDPSYAWTGLMAALLAGSAPLGVAIIGLFFGGLETGALGMEEATSVPQELSQVLQAIIILLIVARTSVRVGEDPGTGSG
jgi:simple sugar transport system permease protein